MQADMDKIVHVKFEVFMAKMVIKIDPDRNVKYDSTEQGKTVIYAALSKVLYGTLRAFLLLLSKVTGRLVLWGYKINPYDWCVANNMIDKKVYCTLACGQPEAV